MLRSFSFYNPTKIYFGKYSLDNLKAELIMAILFF